MYKDYEEEEISHQLSIRLILDRSYRVTALVSWQSEG